MKKRKNIFGIIAILAVIGFIFTACDGDGNDDCQCPQIGSTGPGGGIIFYHLCAGFTVTGTGSFKAYSLEAAPVNQATLIRWATVTDLYNSPVSDEASAIAIGTGRNNTALILAGDPTAPAALACKNYNGGGKTDWFLPSINELSEMYKVRVQLGIEPSGLWSSSKLADTGSMAWILSFGNGNRFVSGNGINDVRAIRAF